MAKAGQDESSLGDVIHVYHVRPQPLNTSNVIIAAHKTIRTQATPPSPNSAGRLILLNLVASPVVQASEKVHPSFGELALIESRKRAASVVALSDGALWALERCARLASSHEMQLNLIESIDLL